MALEEQFWRDKWQRGEIGFHLPCVHPLLERFLPELNLEEGDTVFLPLCGKALDIGFLMSQGFNVVGVELSELAIQQLFSELEETPSVRDWAGGTCWRTEGLTVFQGDFFDLTADDLGALDAVYDRAALVALPPETRKRYAARMVEITYAARQLVISFEYDQSQMDGPPFAVPTGEIGELYGDVYELRELSREDIIVKAERFRERGLDSFTEVAWHLVPGASASERLS